MEIEDRKGEANIAYHIRGIEGDMGQSTRLELIQQADGDVIVSLVDLETGDRLGIEFCTRGSGGKSPEMFRGLQGIISGFVRAKAEKESPKQNPRYWGGWHFVAPGRELYLCVLRVLKRQQGKAVSMDELLRDEGILSCYTPRYFMSCNPPDVRRASQSVKGAIGYLRRKGHTIESARAGFGQTAYIWLGE